jgi:hypothetical protein
LEIKDCSSGKLLALDGTVLYEGGDVVICIMSAVIIIRFSSTLPYGHCATLAKIRGCECYKKAWRRRALPRK